jgi:serine phosphatase RsbU (regulator of sigma subunit)
MSPESDSSAVHRLRGRSLTFARILWLLTVALLIGLFIVSIPAAYRLAVTPCSDAECRMDPVRLTPQGFLTLQARGIQAGAFAVWIIGLDVIFFLVSLSIAALIFWRKSDDRMALFVSFTLLLFGGVAFINSPRMLMSAYPDWRLPVLLLELAGSICFSIFLCVFPNGRFVPPWMRWLALVLIIIAFTRFLLADTPLDPDQYPGLETFLLVVLFATVIAAQVYRYRRVSNSTERQQTKWVVFGFVVGVGGFIGVALLTIVLITSLADEPFVKMIGDALVYGFMLLLPLSIGVAMLRSRLYDVDFIIRRTLIYGALTAILAAIYFVCLFVLQNIVLGLTEQTRSSLILISSASALVIAALSRPLRGRIQDFIDRRFYRRKYDAARVIADFGASVREEVDLNRLTSRLLSVTQETLQPEHVSLRIVSGATTTPTNALGSPEAFTSAESIAPNDPLVAYFHVSPSTVELDELRLDSPALRAMRAAGLKLATPMVIQGELIAVLNLGARRSQQDYSAPDRELLDTLAAQVGPAMRVAQLVREQRAQEEQRARIDQEMQLARQIQHALLPKELPAFAGWKLDTFYQPARQVGGDFYDFIPLADGRIGIVIGDVTDKGMPAALLMATTRTTLQAIAQTDTSPGEVLARVNALVCRDIPAKMFVTCLYAILDPATGKLRYANAGHDLPYCWRDAETTELSARGMPLGLMPDSAYEENEALVPLGAGVLFYTDGVVEAHNPKREMFGFPRLRAMLGECPTHVSMNQFVREQLIAFTGADWEQEDDITMVTLQRTGVRLFQGV